MDTTRILGELLGGGSRGSGSLNTGSGAKMLEDLLGVGKGAPSGGSTGTPTQQAPGGGIFGGASPQSAPTGGAGQAGGLGDLLGKALKELKKGTQQRGTQNRSGGGGTFSGQNPFEVPAQPPRFRGVYSGNDSGRP